MERFAALAPGYAVGALVVGLGDLPGVLFPSMSDLGEASIRVAVWTASSILVILALPDAWLPASISQLRRRLYIFGDRQN